MLVRQEHSKHSTKGSVCWILTGLSKHVGIQASTPDAACEGSILTSGSRRAGTKYVSLRQERLQAPMAFGRTDLHHTLMVALLSCCRLSLQQRTMLTLRTPTMVVVSALLCCRKKGWFRKGTTMQHCQIGKEASTNQCSQENGVVEQDAHAGTRRQHQERAAHSILTEGGREDFRCLSSLSCDKDNLQSQHRSKAD